MSTQTQLVNKNLQTNRIGSPIVFFQAYSLTKKSAYFRQGH